MNEIAIDNIFSGDRRALARAITLVESTRRDHRQAADALLEAALPESGKATRLGITGVPGAGKSTFIEAFGLALIDQGHRVAVLAVDPSSQRSGGSILGDKTRMERLSRNSRAFIRPSPTAGSIGGVARRTREALLLCEAAGFDVILVETVGVGQSETAVAELVDMFLLLLVPGGGDELQGLKKGIVELADLLLINKSDGALKDAARRAAAEYRGALQLLRPASPNWTPRVQLCSALEEQGIDEVWKTVTDFRDKMTESGEWSAKRAQQAKGWLWNEVSDSLLATLRREQQVAEQIPALERAVVGGKLAPSSAARQLLEAFAAVRSKRAKGD
ncbi:MAG: methylmalonyl Co-A mutase-associated GTPase MeaB [Pseudomonadota bacterium]